jgi:nucleoside-diphosphate-sugar epimerase
MRVLLFGGTGFLGAHVAAACTAAGDTVVAPPRAELDLSTAAPGTVTELIRAVGPDAVLNCAGATTGPVEALAAGNVVAVATLLAGWEGHRSRLIHLGSAAEYGAVPGGVPVTERTAPAPVAPYGITKLAGTALLTAAHARGRPATVLRVFNPLGPGTPAALLPGRLVEQLRHAARSGVPARVGRLDGHRDFVDARDVAAAVRAAAAAPGPLPAVLNVAGGRAVSLRAFAARAAELAGVPAPIEEVRDSVRSAAVLWQQADLTATAAALGWSPRISLDDSLRDMGLVEALAV